MLERKRRSAGFSLPVGFLICCWLLSASPAGSRPAAVPDSGAGSVPASPSRSGRAFPLDPSAPSVAVVHVDSLSHLRAPARGPFPGAPLIVTVPLSDLPYGFHGGFESPSMQQSLQWRAGSTQLADQTIGWMWEALHPGLLRSFGTWGSLALFNYMSVYLPLGGGWTHEEWHRAVLTSRGHPSYDGIYHWDIGAETISVDHVGDQDLSDLKAQHPADFTRLMEAGIESETEGGRLMRRNNFFLGRRSEYDMIDWWTTAVNGTLYIYICSVDDFDADLLQANRNETRESQRDFTGLDFRAWVYDMRHPHEAYQDSPRGRIHPSGSGFDRYLLYSDLSANERGYLRLQAGLSLLNLVSPQMIGRDWLPGENPWGGQAFLWNFGLMHHLTPFGYDVGGDFLVRRGKWSWVFTAQGLVNGEMLLPGLGGELYRYPLMAGSTEVFVTCGASAWLQPEDQLYQTTSVLPGASAKIGAAVPLRWSLELFGEADAKTAGWVAGNVYLDAALQARAGLQLRL